MPNYDPQLPNPQAYNPDWSNSVGKPVEEPLADKSKGIMLNTIGEGIGTGLSIADNQFKDYLKEKVESGVRALQDTTTAAYESIRRAQIAGVPPDPRAVSTAGFSGSLSGGSGTDVPEGLQAGIDKAGQLTLAKAQGKANDTLYTGALNSLAKQLRAEYPGHRDFIDEQIAKVSGKNPANAYMENLLTDINRSGTKDDTFQKHILSLAFDPKYGGNIRVQTAIAAVEQGKPGAWGVLQSAVFDSVRQWSRYDVWKANRDVNNSNLEDDKDNAKNEWEIRSNDILKNHMSPTFEHTGLTDPNRIAQIIQDDLNGNVKIDNKQRLQLADSLHAAWLAASREMEETGSQYTARIKDAGTYVKTTNENKLKLISDMENAIRDEKFGTALAIKRKLDGQLDESRARVYGSDMGEWVRTQNVISKELGPVWANYGNALSMGKGKNLKDMESIFSDSTGNAMISPDLRVNDNYKSLYDTVKAVNNAKKQGANVPARTYDNLVENVDIINKAAESATPHRTEIVDNVVDYMFDPAKNGKLMDLFGRDYVDENGNPQKGKFAVWNVMTKPRMVDNIWNVGSKESQDKLTQWSEFSFRRLFGSEVKQLGGMAEDKSMPFKLSWDSEHHRFEGIFGKKPTTDIEANYQAAVNKSINAVNTGLGPLSYIHEKTGKNTNEYLWDVLAQTGIGPSESLGGSLPKKMQDAIRAAHTPPPTAAEASRKASGKKEE